MSKRISAIAAVMVLLGGSAAFAEAPSALLKALPAAAKGSLATLFTANAIGQTGLNGQLKGTPQGLLDQLRASLSKAGYAEQPIRTTIGAWGFSATWAPPAGKSVTQATALGPDKLNLNIRFEGIAASSAETHPDHHNTEPSQRPAGLSMPRGLF